MAGDALTRALERVAALPRLVVASDFDGTLAPFVHDPMTARAAAGGLDVLRELAGMPGTQVAVVSGRDVATLTQLTGIPAGPWTPQEAGAGDRRPPIVLVGSHGAQSSVAGVAGGVDAEGLELRRDSLVAALRAVALRHTGTRVEVKATAAALHTRGLPAAVARDAEEEAAALGTSRRDVRVIVGNSVVELSLSHADKGSALLALLAQWRADALVYFGDDTTDEDAFMKMNPGRDVAVKVGDGDTAAGFRVDGPEQVVAALRQLADARR